VLFVQDDIADKVVEMLAGAMAELVRRRSRPAVHRRRPGDRRRRQGILDAMPRAHGGRSQAHRTRDARAGTEHGTFFAPRAYEELNALDANSARGSFGPVLHVLRWKADQLDK
jgi:RHH-type proline utilization regulon transcriptional repressor/proline dehydrogenase/delta 1-pyrroline-5-carboxylate dehydrogenase